MAFRGQASSAKITSLGDKLTALACHPTKRVKKAEDISLYKHWLSLSAISTLI